MAQTKPKAGQFYGVSNNGTDGEFLQTDGTGGMSWASPITNPTITSIDYPGSATAADPAGGESVIINGTLFASGITCTVGGTSAVTAFNSATQITITTPAKAAGPYAVAVLNPDGGTASENNFIQYSGVPVWSTAAGTLGNVLEGAAASFQVTATEGSDTIEYAVTTGTLPTGLSLATATGAITGTTPAVSADTTTTFSITATDDENQTSASRSFSITVQNDAPSNHFNIVLYTGNGASSRSITGVGFAPDFTWTKKRGPSTADNLLQNTVQGAGTGSALYSNKTSTAGSTDQYGYISAFGTDGVTYQAGSSGSYPSDLNNENNSTYVAWNFKAGGAAVANTDGTINSDVSVNNTLGFSIVSYTGNGSSGNVGHGLNAIPELIIAKNLDGTNSWVVRVNSLGNGYLTLNDTPSYSTTSIWGNPTNSVFNFTHPANGQTLNNRYIAYCFTSKPGFSKVGSYTGNGSVSGPMVQTGFEIAFLMIKSASSSGTAWNMWDNKRTPYDMLRANTSEAEFAGPGRIQFFANGFQLLDADASRNSSGGNYIYLAIAADGSTATPSLANSFDTELYTGNGGTQSVTTGFKPDLVWLKERSGTQWHGLYDSIRGVGNRIVSNSSNAENFYAPRLTSFNSNGFSIGSDGDTNTLNDTYVSWNWKAGGTPSINTDGSTTSLVSANQAAGFSVVQYTAAGTTIAGHGLSQAPELIIQRLYNITSNWFVYSAPTGLLNYLKLDETSVLATDSSWISAVTNSTFTEAWSGGSYSYINYCWHSVAGYSKVGSYNGTSATGNVISTGFEPGFVMIKSTTLASAGSIWFMYDNKRNTSNPRDTILRANDSSAESNFGSPSPLDINFLANGFTINGTYNGINGTGETYIYLAIKEN